jgi:hypothetical protein
LPTGAGGSALRIFPEGMTILKSRKHPSSTGEMGLTRALEATRAAATAPDSPELIVLKDKERVAGAQRLLRLPLQQYRKNLKALVVLHQKGL